MPRPAESPPCRNRDPRLHRARREDDLPLACELHNVVARVRGRRPGERLRLGHLRPHLGRLWKSRFRRCGGIDHCGARPFADARRERRALRHAFVGLRYRVRGRLRSCCTTRRWRRRGRRLPLLWLNLDRRRGVARAAATKSTGRGQTRRRDRERCDYARAEPTSRARRRARDRAVRRWWTRYNVGVSVRPGSRQSSGRPRRQPVRISQRALAKLGIDKDELRADRLIELLGHDGAESRRRLRARQHAADPRSCRSRAAPAACARSLPTTRA